MSRSRRGREPLPAWAVVNIGALIRRFSELNTGAFRPVEWEALQRIETQQRVIRSLGRRLDLSPLYIRFVRLERAALHYYPYLSYDDHLCFIIVNAHEPGKSRQLRLPYTEREVRSILDTASAVLALREAYGLADPVSDFTEAEARRLHQRYLSHVLRETPTPVQSRLLVS